ncbi:MAG: hypothetical protein ACLPKW_26270, partial [Acetobacteraceae bacterium]
HTQNLHQCAAELLAHDLVILGEAHGERHAKTVRAERRRMSFGTRTSLHAGCIPASAAACPRVSPFLPALSDISVLRPGVGRLAVSNGLDRYCASDYRCVDRGRFIEQRALGGNGCQVPSPPPIQTNKRISL